MQRTGFCLLLPFLVLLFPLTTIGDVAGEAVKYYIVIDAGSSGCRIHIYRYFFARGELLPTISLPDKKLKKSPGLSSFASHPSDAGASLSGLIAFAMENVPTNFHAVTPVRLAATAGLRMVPADTAKQILDSCYEYMSKNSPFLIKRDKISIISGQDEGAYGWLSLNFLLKRLEGMADASLGTVGTIEMGGASAQVTVQIGREAASEEDSYPTTYQLHLDGQTYKLYVHSYLGFGQEQARHKYNEMITAEQDPCFPAGYIKDSTLKNDEYAGRTNGPVIGTGNFSQCKRNVDRLFKSNEACNTPPCSFAGVHQPRFWQSKQSRGIVLFENFFHSSRALSMPNMETGITVDSFLVEGSKFCSLR
eukprot:756188-Hanusia_phi.AAC.2